MQRLLKAGFAAALFTFILSTACTKVPDSSKDTSKASVKIGFVIATMQQERYKKDRDYFIEAAKKAGAEVLFASCEDKVTLQTAKVETLLAKGVDVLVLQPVNGQAASGLVKMAKRDGVPVVAYDRIIQNAPIDLYVTQDSFQVGVIQAKAAVEATQGKGNFVILKGEAGHSVAEGITAGNRSVLKDYPGIKVVLEQNHPGWSTALALASTENALTRYGNKIHAVLANNDGMALGATQALEEQKLSGKVFVAGADADVSAIKAIRKKQQTLTVLKGIRPLADAAVKGALELAKKKQVTFDTHLHNGTVEVPTVNTPVYRVALDNYEKVVIDSGFHPRASIFGAE